MSVALPILVTSLDPENPYSEQCITFVVNAHGCGVRAPQPIGPKTPVRLEVGSAKRTATAHVVMCTAIRGKKDLWELGIELDTPSNIWGFHFPPTDWIQPMQTGGEEKPSEESSPAPSAAATAPLAASSGEVEISGALQMMAGPQGPSIAPLLASPPVVPLPAPTLAVPMATAQAPAAVQAKEVTISLTELKAELGIDVAPPSAIEVAEPAKKEVTPPSIVKPDRQEATQESEQELRERARRVSAEFEEDYRRSLGELLARLRADLEGQATDDWNRALRQAEERLQAQVAEQSSELQRRQDETQALLNAKLEELHNLRDYVESLLRTAAETEGKQFEQRLQVVLDQAAQDARQALLDDFDRHEREFLDRIAVRLEEVRASADHTREFAKRTSTDMARQSEQLRVDLQSQFDSLFEQQRQELATRLEERHQRLSQAAHTALQNLGGHLWGSLRQQLNADFEARDRALQQTLRKAEAETRKLQEFTEKLAARLDVNLEAHLDQAVEDTSSRAQNQLQQLLGETQEQARRQLEAEREHLRARDEQGRQALTESLRAQREALLAEFKRDSESTAADCLAQYQTAMRETLESIEEVLRNKLRLPR